MILYFTQHGIVKGTKYLLHKKMAKLSFSNWTSRNEKIVEKMRMSRFLLHLLIDLKMEFILLWHKIT